MKKEEELPDETAEDESEGGTRKPKFIPVNFRDACVSRVQDHLGQPLVKRSFAVYSSPEEALVVICINSREYKKVTHTGYWFAFHSHQRDLLQNYKRAFVALGCGSPDLVFLIPALEFVSWLDRFHKTERGDRFYWHVRVTKGKGGYFVQVKKGTDQGKLDKYILRS